MTVTNWSTDLIAKIEARVARVGVVGLGYVGLPLCLQALEAGFEVIGFDIDRNRLASIGRSESYLVDVTNEQLAQADQSGRFTTTDDPSATGTMDVILIAVPTPLVGGVPDLSFVFQAVDGLVPYLRTGLLVSLESTTYPGTTEETLVPRLETGGLTAGEDFALVFSPERIDPGNHAFAFSQIPKVVGGLTPRCSAVAESFYSSIVDKVVVVSGPREAEMTKLLENTYRQVNIALANEFAMVAHELDIDIWEVIAAASTKPFGFHPFYPGIGIGGHCIAVDPVYLTWRIRELGRAPFRLVELAREVDMSMPRYVARRIIQVLMDDGVSIEGADIFVLGLTYKPDVDDIRESRAIDVFAELAKAGAAVSFHDPFRQEADVKGTIYPRRDLDRGLDDADLVAILTHHSSYDWPDIVLRSARVFDARGVTRKLKGDNIRRL